MKKYIVLITMLVLVTLVLAAPTKVTIWYSQTGIYSQTLLDIVDEFNKLHEGKIVVEPIYTGSYSDTLTKLLAAMMANDLPTLSQIEQSRIGQFIELLSLHRPLMGSCMVFHLTQAPHYFMSTEISLGKRDWIQTRDPKLGMMYMTPLKP